jgi:hypothetical protein
MRIQAAAISFRSGELADVGEGHDRRGAHQRDLLASLAGRPCRADDASMAALELVGNELNNTINGNDGQSTIVGGFRLDVMTGAGSGDTFVWTSTDETRLPGQEADIVMDFNRAGGDLLAFNPIDANATGGTNGGDILGNDGTEERARRFPGRFRPEQKPLASMRDISERVMASPPETWPYKSAANQAKGRHSRSRGLD